MYKVEVWKRNDAEKLHTEYNFETEAEAQKYAQEVDSEERECFVVDDDGNIIT